MQLFNEMAVQRGSFLLVNMCLVWRAVGHQL